MIAPPLIISQGHKVSKEECDRIFVTHSYLRTPPNFRTCQVLDLLVQLNNTTEPIYHLGMNYHQPSHGIHPLDDQYGYRKDGKVAVLLSRLVSGTHENWLRTIFDVGKGKPLECLKARLLVAGILYAFEQMKAGVVVDYIDQEHVKNLEEARNLIHRVCNTITPVSRLQEKGKFYVTYWVHSQYLR